jgi:hypothetical protein
VIRPLTYIRRRVRCWLRTHGLHELDLPTGRCRYCHVSWDRLYKTPRPVQSQKVTRQAPREAPLDTTREATKLPRTRPF